VPSSSHEGQSEEKLEFLHDGWACIASAKRGRVALYGLPRDSRLGGARVPDFFALCAATPLPSASPRIHRRRAAASRAVITGGPVPAKLEGKGSREEFGCVEMAKQDLEYMGAQGRSKLIHFLHWTNTPDRTIHNAERGAQHDLPEGGDRSTGSSMMSVQGSSDKTTVPFTTTRP